MIKLIRGEERSHYPDLIAQMHRLRYDVFHKIKNWEVPLINSWEIDGYDALNPLYVLALDENGRVSGSCRLLPTMGFNMLNDTFPQLLPEGHRVESPRIWECSRFAIDVSHYDSSARRRMARATAELGLAMNEIGMWLGLTHIVGVYDEAMNRMLNAFGCGGDPLCGPVRVGCVDAYSVLYEVGAEWLERVARVSGVQEVEIDGLDRQPSRRKAA